MSQSSNSLWCSVLRPDCWHAGDICHMLTISCWRHATQCQPIPPTKELTSDNRVDKELTLWQYICKNRETGTRGREDVKLSVEGARTGHAVDFAKLSRAARVCGLRKGGGGRTSFYLGWSSNGGWVRESSLLRGSVERSQYSRHERNERLGFWPEILRLQLEWITRQCFLWGQKHTHSHTQSDIYKHIFRLGIIQLFINLLANGKLWLVMGW